MTGRKRKKWRIKGDASASGVSPTGPLGLLPLTDELLRGRGFREAGEQLGFLKHSELADLSDLRRLPGMAAAIQAIREAVGERKKIWIYGDYDADGMTATALLIKALACLGSKADYYIPHRFEEGYGLHKEALRQIRDQGAELLITVDCGVASADEAAFAASIGLPLIVTDHHRPQDELPEALALIDPELMEEPGESRGLSGAGVAFALAYCLYQELGADGDLTELAQLAAIGCLADGMPMIGDSRVLTALGLEGMNLHPLPGILAMAVNAGLDGKTINESHVVFTFAPRLNASGRLEDPNLGVKLLLAESRREADPYVQQLEALNKRRQELDSGIYEELAGRISETPELAEPPVLIFAGEGWHVGVIGITATRLLEKYRKPVILISFDGETGRGSGRSLPGYSLHQALAGAAGLLSAFGGHEYACGLRIDRGNLESFRTRMLAFAPAPGQGQGEESEDETEGEIEADLIVSPGQMTLRCAEDLERLAPFGAGNPRPLFVLLSMKLTEQKPMGRDKRHYQLFYKPDLPETASFVAFNMEDAIFYPQVGKVYDLLFQPEINEWQGRRSLRLVLKDFRESEGPSAGSGKASGKPPDWSVYRENILGAKDYRDKQIEALDALAAGRNTMLMMATGRGKTAVFQTAAAAMGPLNICIVVYPLRSLARDQIGRMEKALGPLGIHAALAWGGLDHWEKRFFFNELYQGRIRFVISTAEFLQAHLDKFEPVAERIGLFVVDEAHHLGTSHRQAYRDLQKTWHRLGSPLFLATTATADDACADKIIRDFNIASLVTEEHCRENLTLRDGRGRDNEGKLAYLLGEVQPGGKMIIYVNSRPLTEEICRALQDNLPSMKNSIGYYHGGLPPESRQEAEKAFRAGEWQILVSTSAFGEGADIPDIRDVVLYHLCFSRAEYNQLSGRAGRDGQTARIHLLYNKKDEELNRLLLREEAPDREVLGGFYLYLREKAAVANPLSISDEDMAREVAQRGYHGFSGKTAGYCLGILEEISLLLREETEGRRDVHMAPPPPARLDLKQSSLYMEGQKNVILFEEYVNLAFSPDLPRLLEGVNRPILPERRRNHDG
ncbi:MAG: single-stranded-DNA-specific exonuclease RecJ [Clostridiales bacterium]|nr:single-stranded-DNA-specific exonuclease RecJ [Clostridiales bacterium]